MNKITVLSVAAAAIFATACAKKEKQAMSMPPTPAVMVQAQSKSVPKYISTLGTMSSLSSVKIVPQVSGQIMEIKFKQGDAVKTGDVLAVIDKRPYAAAVKQAEGNLRQARAQLKIDELQVERNRQLAKDNYVDKQTFDSLVAKVEVDKGVVETAEASLETAKINLDWCDIKVPADGKVGLYNLDIGNVASAGVSQITTIERIDRLYVDFVIPSQRLYESLNLMKKQGGKVDIVVKYVEDDLPYSRETTASIVLNKIRYETGTAVFRGEVENSDSLFWPDQPVRVIFNLEKNETAVLVPDISIQTNNSGSFVYVATPYKDGVYIVKQVQVKTGQLYEKNTLREVEGVKAGDFIVTQVSQLRLHAGPFVYRATADGIIMDADGKPITTPEGMMQFMMKTAKIADNLRADMKAKMIEAAKPQAAQKAAMQKATDAASSQPIGAAKSDKK